MPPAPEPGAGRPVLRTVTPADWPLWREARVVALTTSPEAFGVRLADWGRGGEERWRARFDDPETYGVLALLDGRPVGLAGGLLAPDGLPELRSVWVAPGARGHGLAARLIAAVETWAHGGGATVLRLSVLRGNTEAIALYERLGHAPAAVPTTAPATLPSAPELVMTKVLPVAG
ncbi:GNAT family N-acetyltransferase [Streptomyces sp. NPDC001728]|uniref:GNAT family N-acetyltransferase n=1 Tax=Streptomyces sp. NPDC001728 TaxID=3154396 RepID=UPI003324FD04